MTRPWNEPEPLYSGDALTDLHHPHGTKWVKDPLRGYWPDCCDTHRPESKRVGTKGITSDGFLTIDGFAASESPLSNAEPEIDEPTALRLLATWLRKLSKEKR